ncbi:hypothetical protein LV780_04905 [Cereibacter azotoformans]|uniref:hypothetical protein n=1 Tax=Cereibacter azotoformans TaxID=43057 RepID=UPI000E35FABE|nr:hypothetical protein [Cereibacter azotoformans]AXQ93208.1 hypothetical protein D0Z66_04895 [Cereibacter sphaeroides]UIJ31520.1 hypothetical protein LV780_04905 [Cereibacter azotoformans]
MNRTIIDVPRIFMRPSAHDWRIDWRGQSAGEGIDGEQIVYNRLPRFVGAPVLEIPRDLRGHWRALIMRGEGRRNAYRMRMVDPVSYGMPRSGRLRDDIAAFLTGHYVEPRPRVPVVGAVSAGETSLVVDETGLPSPIRVGGYLSHNDWPFAVVARSGSGSAVTLTVRMLRKAIPDGALIDVFARGIFLSTEDAMGLPAFSRGSFGVPLSVIEWIGR